MRKGWTETTLGEIINLEYGKPLKAENRDGKGFPVFGSAGEVGLHSEPLLNESPVIVVGRKGTAGAVWWSDLPCSVIDTAYYVVRKSDADIRFLYFLLGFLDLPSLTAQTGVPGLNRDRAHSSQVLLPPLVEQKRIVDLVSSVDAYIDALQQQSDSARMSRDAVLNDLLSAGGDDWAETRIGEFVFVQSGFAFSAKDWSEDGYPVVKINNVRDGNVSLESCSFVSHPLPKGSEKFQLHRGDLLITLTGEIGATGTVSVEGPLFLNQRVGKVTVSDDSRAILGFVAYLLSSSKLRSEMWSLGKGNAQLNISPSSIHGLSVNLPPLAEQKRISEIMSSLDVVIHSTEQAVLDAKALRCALLSDLLSGNHEIPASYDSLLGAA